MIRFAKLAPAALAFAALLPIAAPAQAFDSLSREIYLVNQTDETIMEVRMTHVDERSWGEDVIPAFVVEPGEVALVSPQRHNGYCRFNLKIEFESGSIQTIRNLNACDALAVAVTNPGMVVLNIDGDAREYFHNASF